MAVSGALMLGVLIHANPIFIEGHSGFGRIHTKVAILGGHYACS